METEEPVKEQSHRTVLEKQWARLESRGRLEGQETWVELTKRQIRTIMGNLGDSHKKERGKKREGIRNEEGRKVV